MVLNNHRIAIRAVDVGISFGSCQTIFTNVLGMKRAAAKIIPKLLNFEPKQCRNDPDLLKKVITGDESWVRCYDIETNHPKRTEELRPKKACQVW